MHRTDAAVVDALHAGGDLVMNVAGFEHGSRLVFPVLWRQSAFDSLLAIPQNLGVISFHSKWPFVGCGCGRDKLNSTSIYGHFELFYPRHKQITLVEGLAEPSTRATANPSGDGTGFT